MNRWIPYAFVRIVLFLMAGVCVSIFHPDLVSVRVAKLICLSALFVYVAIVVVLRLKNDHKRATNLKVYAGTIALCGIFFAGMMRVEINTESNIPEHIINADSIDFFRLVVSSSVSEKEKSWKTEALVQEINIKGKWKPSMGTIMLYLSKQAFQPPVYGDVFIVKGKPNLVPPPANPEEFDYRRFLTFKHIYHQRFIKKNDAVKIGFMPPSWITFYALKSREWADRTIRDHVSGEREKGLASALVLGVTDGLDNELLSAYRATGTLHVLAVSGLHVGILYGLILLIFKPLNKLRAGPWIIAFVSVVLLWAYGFVTGLSPSVLRAVTMFSFVAIAKPGGHRTNIYNTLAVSAFFILWYDPFFIMSVGFQLSYLAVLGIVYIQPALFNLWNPSNRMLDEIWKVSSVSIAAQVSTFSLSLFYFHQFPNYFLLSNLVAIPASFVVLILGLGLLALQFLSHLANALGFLLEWVIKAMNAVMFAIEDLPFSLVENVYITPLQCWLLFAIIFSILVLMHTKRFSWVKAVFILGAVFCGIQWHHYNSVVNIRKITIYNIAGHTAVDFFDKGNVFFFADSLLTCDQQKIDFHITGNRIKSGARNIKPGPMIQQSLNGCSLTVWNKKSVLRIYDPSFSIPDELRVDFVIISNNAVTNVDGLLKQIDAKNIILDSSNSRYNASKLVRLSSIPAEIHAVTINGAFELEI